MALADNHQQMSVETVNNLQKILDTTLGSFLDLVQCDGGSVYTVRKDADGEQILTFEAMIRAASTCTMFQNTSAAEIQNR
jgi:hypothetical protein